MPVAFLIASPLREPGDPNAPPRSEPDQEHPMRAIRSLLWIGSGRGLSESGVTEAPELDVTWVPDLDAATRLPRVHFDGLLLECPGPDTLADCAAALARWARGAPILACLPARFAERAQEVLDGGAAAVLFLDEKRPGPGVVSQINEVLDEVCARDRSDSPTGANAAPAAHRAHPTPPPRSSEGPVADESPAPIVSRSPRMHEVLELVDRAASSPSTVLLTGETGTGKEVIARELHTRSGRSEEPFVAINCAAFPETLLESELFGHVKGAFTGADRAKSGLFEAALDGTLFLDEIAEMGLPLQAKLLRVLEERELRPVGGTRVVRIECRIVAATNRVLAEEVAAGHFREDLFYRLNVFPIRIPPLRERKHDILPLARHFVALHGPREGKLDCHLSLATSQLLQSYPWPGNVRELENEMLRALMMTASGELITPKSLSPRLVEILEPVAQGARPDETLKEALERVEAWLIRRALANNGGRKTRTARKLGLTREGLYKKLKRLGIE
jgi:DNA-binding NtrC family response regulator